MPRKKITTKTRRRRRTTPTNKFKNGSFVKRTVFKPRHGLRMHCDLCSWTFRGGGYETKKQRTAVEKEQIKLHEALHNTQKQGLRTLSSTTPTLQIEKDTHPAELPHAYVEQTTRQTTTSATYVDVPGATITSSNFTAGQKYLILVTAQFDVANTTDLCYIKLIHGTTDYEPSESAVELVNASARGNYMWWVHQTAVSGEDVTLQFRSSTAGVAVGIDQVSMTAWKLTPDLTQNVDYFIGASDTGETLVQDTDSNPDNNGRVTFVPTTPAHRWLILSRAKYGPGIISTNAVQSRIKRSGQAANESVVMQQEGEDGTQDRIILCGARVDTLAAQSNTYEEVSTCKNTSTPASGIVRSNSAIFALDLDKFKNVAFSHEDGPQETPNSSTTPYAELIQTTSITPEQVGDVFCMGFVTVDWGGSGRQGKIRMQVDNVDQPGGSGATNQTNDSYNFDQWDTADLLPVCLQTVENLSAASHTIDLDGSCTTDPTTPTPVSAGTVTRTIVAFSFEMGTAIINTVVNETEAITESVTLLIGAGLKFIVNENVGITESVIMKMSSASLAVTADNLQLRLSGGVDNSDPDSSLGGEKSTATEFITEVFVVDDFEANDFQLTATGEGGGAGIGGGFSPLGFFSTGFVVGQGGSDVGISEPSVIGTRLLDDVLQSEAIAGDTADYRCFYLHNTHSTLTMDGLKIWLVQNTPAADVVTIGLGTSAINGIEQTIANESTAPTGVTFTLAPTELDALNAGTLPAAGGHKAIWIKRVVPSGTSAPFLNNTYQLKVKFYSSHT